MPSELLAESLRQQALNCADYDSPLYAGLLERACADLEAGGPTAALLADWQGHPVLDALPMRIMGAVHGEVLAGRAPELARFFPSVGGVADAEAAWPAFRAVLEQAAPRIRERLDQPVQTNEVRRSAALLGGFLRIAQQAGLPIALHEVGASSGLNLLWDRHRYALGPHRWGDPTASLRLETTWTGPPPPLDAKVDVVERAASDLRPIDLEDAEARDRLESFIWADQPRRLAELRTAIAIAREAGIRVETGSAAAWLGERLATPRPGRVTAVYHSVFWWYLPEAERERVIHTMEQAGRRATRDAPLAWLRMEGVDRIRCELRLRFWPFGEDQLLARVHYHGRFVDWADTAAAR